MIKWSIFKKLMPRTTWLQPAYEKLYFLAITGMNYNSVSDRKRNGEIGVIKSIIQEEGRDGLICFDVGANQGDYTKMLLELGGEKIRVFSFEPLSVNFKILKQTYGTVDKVKVFNIGFGKKAEEKNIYFGAKGLTLASIFKRELAHGLENDQAEQISIKRLDQFCDEQAIDKIDFLKLDVEGSEYDCLAGAEELIRNKRINYIQFEFGGTQIDSRLFFRDYWKLLSPNYQLYRVVSNGAVPINFYDERLEIFHAVNFLARRRGLA